MWHPRHPVTRWEHQVLGQSCPDGSAHGHFLRSTLLAACSFSPQTFHVPDISNFQRYQEVLASSSQNQTLSYQGLFPGTPTLPHTAWHPKLSFEISVEASVTPQVLHSACLQSHHHVTNAKDQCKLYLSCPGQGLSPVVS
jgi:hypothetical protein